MNCKRGDWWRARTSQVQNEILNCFAAAFSYLCALLLEVVEHLVVEVLGVGEVDGSVDTNGYNAGCNGSVRVLLHVPVDVRSGDIAQASSVWSRYVVKNFDEGDADGDEEADFHRDEEHAEERTQGRQEVELVDLPDEPRCLEVDQRRDRGDDDGGQDGVGRVLEQRRQHPERECHHDSHDDVRHGGLHSCLVVHGRPRE
jgi:hypothetical protein